MDKYIKKKKDMNFPSVEALQPIVNVVNEASVALKDSKRTTRESAIPEVLTGVMGAGVGGVISFNALYGLGTVGLSAAGITSGLATAGGTVSALVGSAVSPMVAGIFVLAAPVAGLAAGGVGIASYLKYKQLKQEKERLYQEVLKKHQAILAELKKDLNKIKERQDYLESLNILLTQALNDLRHDLGYAS